MCREAHGGYAFEAEVVLEQYGQTGRNLHIAHPRLAAGDEFGLIGMHGGGRVWGEGKGTASMLTLSEMPTSPMNVATSCIIDCDPKSGSMPCRMKNPPRVIAAGRST